MSVETLAILISAAGLLITLGGGIFAGFAWIIRRTDAQFAAVHEQFRAVRGEFRADLHQLREELTEVKISVAVLKAHVTISSGPAVQRSSSHPMQTVIVDFGFADLNKVSLGFHHLSQTG